MSLDDITAMTGHFVETAKRALESGYKILELHAAHGYLPHSFLTPLINTRTDAYGGDLRGRARFLLETVEAVRAVWPEHLPLATRISIHDWIEGGHRLKENIQIAKWLKEAGVDMVDCSGGGATPKARGSIGERTSSQVDLAGELRAATGLTTMAVGYITDAKQANALIENGTCDITLLGRQLLRNPHWPTHAAQELGVDPKPHMPVQYHVVAG
jgi:2,4-dienoyl-CoA reductase-like NADH-dependent reductase (Old Yellow Enzyme family)